MQKTKIISIIMAVIILVAPGLCLTVVGLKTHLDNSRFMKTAVETKAEIVYIESTQVSDDIRYKVTVRFSVDGHDYSGLLGEHKQGMERGDEVSIYYDPTNPNDFRGIMSTKWQGIGITAAGMILLFIGIKLLFA